MSVSQEQLPDRIWMISASGRVDQSLTPQLEAVLTERLDSGDCRLVVNLSQATYINSGGLRCLVSAWRKSKEQGGDLVLCGLNARLQEIFSLVGFDRVFRIYDTCQEARERLQEQ